MVAFLDNIGETAGWVAAGGQRREQHTAADHIAVLDAVLAQLPAPADAARCTKAFLTHVRGLRDSGVSSEVSPLQWAIGERGDRPTPELGLDPGRRRLTT